MILVGMVVHQIGTWGPGRVLFRDRETRQVFVEWATGMTGWYHQKHLEQGWEDDFAQVAQS